MVTLGFYFKYGTNVKRSDGPSWHQGLSSVSGSRPDGNQHGSVMKATHGNLDGCDWLVVFADPVLRCLGVVALTGDCVC